MEVEQVYGLYGKNWKGLVVPEAMSHPAKFSRKLVYWIITTGLERGWWDYGDTILDPFGGVGLGGIAASDYFLTWLGVELEPKFVALAEENFALNRQRWLKDGAPMPIIIQGDSRELGEIVPAALEYMVITSPPFMGSRLTTDKKFIAAIERDQRNGSRFQGGFEGGADSGYGSTSGQIGVMPEGNIAVLTSPPYVDTIHTGEQTDKARERKAERFTRGEFHTTRPDIFTSQKNVGARAMFTSDYGEEEGQIGAMKEGDLGVITSPPFSQPDTRDRSPVQEGSISDFMARATTVDSQGSSPENIARLGGITSPPYGNRQGNEDTAGSVKEGMNDTYGGSPGQIAALTSPPYEGQIIRKRSSAGDDERLEAKGLTGHDFGKRDGLMITDAYGDTKDNLGNQKGETYWDAVAQVYQQMYDLFSPGSHAAIVVKSFVRKKQIVDLPQMTLDLLTHIGFEPVSWIETMLTSSKSKIENGHERPEKEWKAFFKRNFEYMCVHRSSRARDGVYWCSLLNEPCTFYKSQLVTDPAKPVECDVYHNYREDDLAIDNEVVLVVKK